MNVEILLSGIYMERELQAAILYTKDPATLTGNRVETAS